MSQYQILIDMIQGWIPAYDAVEQADGYLLCRVTRDAALSIRVRPGRWVRVS